MELIRVDPFVLSPHKLGASEWRWLTNLREELLISLLPSAAILRESGDLLVPSIQLSPEHEQLLLGGSQFIGYLSQLRVQLGNAFALGFTLNTKGSITFTVDSEFVDLAH
jgi:hypothetical protein